MKMEIGQMKVTLRIERRPDGGVRVWSDDVPELVLSGADVRGVLMDVIPAVETILGAQMGCDIKASWLLPYRQMAHPPTAGSHSVEADKAPFDVIAAMAGRRRLELAAACG